MVDERTLQVDRALERFGADLWLTCRKNLGEVEEMLYKLLPCPDEPSPMSPNDRKAILGYIDFISFLGAECSGLGLSSDKQWGQLLNLMQISRKLNHKSVRFRDILANRSVIEANAVKIKQFNEYNRVSNLIKELTYDLESGLRTSQMRIISGTPEYGGVADVDARVLDEITRSKRHLETTIIQPLHNLRLHLQHELVARDNSQQYQEWTSNLNKFTSIVEKLSKFLDNYYTFKKDLIYLKPLVSGFVNQDNQQASFSTKASQNSELLINSLSECKSNFKLILDYNNSLEQGMRDIARKLIRPAGNIRTNKVTSDREETLKLYDLLDQKTLAYVDDIYYSKLYEALKVSENIRQTLDQVMSTLRLEFGRFYFVNDLELLTIISLDSYLIENCNQLENKRLIIKLFNGSIVNFILKNDKKMKQTHIVGVISAAGERIMLAAEQEPVPLRKKVNIYSLEIVRILNELTRKLQRSLRAILMESLETQDDIDWSLPIQLMSLAEQIKFTKRVESTFDIMGVFYYYEGRLKWLSEYHQMQLNESHIDMLKHSEMLSLTVHFISTLMGLSHREVQSIDDWQWQKLARYYRCKANDEIQIRLANTQFMYKFELLPIETSSGLETHETTIKRLIYTETSERCFLVASQAIGRLKLGANPFGPAGSGKTETVKALGQMLGCQVIVHNCDETNDARSLERLIWGLAHTGLWGCFDEFNRLSADTLSSVSSVLEIVQSSLRQNRSTLELEGGQMRNIDPDSAFFITMNPGDSGRYQGRRRLPANLRSLFLPIAMVNVQVDTIVCEMLLAHSGGMQDSSQLPSPIDARSAAELGRKLSRWIVWMRSNLQTNRCEWDLRLVMVFMKRFRMTQPGGMSLDQIIVNSIASDVVPRLSIAQGEVDILIRSYKEIFNVEGLELIHEHQKQLKSQLEVRPGVILLDPSGSSQSRELWRSLVSRDEHTKWFAVNPKSCDREALFGRFDNVQYATHEGQIHPTKWIDGLFTSIVRKSLELLEDEQTHQVWIVLDGSLDPDWIESLNSVLDDNQVLTLSSGERLNFVLPQSKKCIKLIFLADQIEHVSPATISRLGLINLEVSQPAAAEQRSEYSQTHTITMVIVNSKQVATADCIRDRNPGQLRSAQYNCSELSNSNHLFDVLDSTRFLRGEDNFVLINNLALISSQDRWRTRTFVELLKFAVTYGFYYDPEHNIRHLPSNIRFILTTTDKTEISDQRLLWLCNSEPTTGITFNSSVPEIPIDQDTLISKVTSGYLAGIELVYVEDGLTQELLKLIRKSISTTELFLFDSSANVIRSLEKLHILCRQTHVEITPVDHKCCVFLLDSLQLSLMDVKSRANLYHLLNLIANAHVRISFFILLDRHEAAEESSFSFRFWRSMTDKPALLYSPKYDGTYLKDYQLDGTPDVRLPELLASFSERYTITGDFLATLKKMAVTTKAYVDSKRGALIKSLSQLRQLEENIEAHKMTKKREEQDLAEMEAQIEIRFAQMNKELEESKKRSEQIERLKNTQEQKTQQIERNRVDMQSELSCVLPAIESSKSEVSRCLKPEALNEIKTLRAPPKTVEDILSVLFVFLGQDMKSWSSMKTYLAKGLLRDEMTNYDFQARLNEDLLQRIEHEVLARNESFQPDRASRASTAVVPMLNWIQAARQYGRVLTILRPLTDRIRKLETESVSLAQAMQELKDEQATVEERIVVDKKELDRLGDNFRSTKEGLSRLRHDLDRAQIVIGNLSHQLSDWRTKMLEYDKLSCNNWQKLYDLCLVCSSMACYARDNDSLNRLLQTWSEVLGQDQEHLKNLELFLQNHLSIVMECVDEDSALELRLCAPDRTSASAAVSQDLDQLVKVSLIKLMLHFSQNKIAYLRVDPALTSAELAQYLANKKILCADQSKLVHIDTTDGDWQRKADLMMQISGSILLLNTSRSFGASQLDILDYITSRDGSNLPRKMILIDQSQQHPGPLAMSHFTRVIEIGSQVSSMRDSQIIETKIIDHLIEFCEPTISSDIRNLEIELRDKKRQVRKLQCKLARSLIASNVPAQAESPRSELVNLLSVLRQSDIDLSTSIEKISQRLEELRSRRRRYERLAKKAADYYARNLSDLGKIDPFYHMPIERYTKLLLSSGRVSQVNDDIVWSQILAPVMCSMRPLHRGAFCAQLTANESSLSAQEAVMSALIEAANLKSTLGALIEDFASDDTNPTNCKIAIILHEATKSGPQLEIDELMRNQTKVAAAQGSQTWDYQVLCATQNGQLLQAQLDAILSKRRNDSDLRQCVCIANAHLASKWLSDRLQGMTNVAVIGRLLIILISESRVCRPGNGLESLPRADIDLYDEAHFGSNLLDAADLKFWYDELTLDLPDRFTLYERWIMAKQTDVATRDITRQLVLFHVVCQELTKERVESSGEGCASVGARTSWQHWDKYNFDYGQLSLAHATLHQINADNSVAACSPNQASPGSLRESFCHYLSSIVYGSRLETQADEELLERLLDKFLRKHDIASCQIAILDKLLSGFGNPEGQQQQQQRRRRRRRLVVDLIAVPNL